MDSDAESTSGKWVIHVAPSDVDAVWSLVRGLVLGGQLGGAAKTPPLSGGGSGGRGRGGGGGSGGGSGGGGVAGGGDDSAVVIVYSGVDVVAATRVLCVLRAHGLAQGWTHWKSDAQTLAGVYSGARGESGWANDVPVSRYTAPPPEGGVTRVYLNHVVAGAGGAAVPWPDRGGDVRALLPFVRTLVARCAAGGAPLAVAPPLRIEHKKRRREGDDA